MSGFSDSFQEQIAALEAAFANEGTLAVAVLQISPFSTRGNSEVGGFDGKSDSRNYTQPRLCRQG